MIRNPPDISRLLGAILDYDVQFVLAGSVAVQAWDVDVGAPGDLDIIPAIDEINLRKLIELLDEIEAKAFPVTGEWHQSGAGYIWHEFDGHDPRREALPPPLDPLAPSTFDSLFETRYGAFDVMPVISGRFEDVSRRSTRMTVYGVDDVRVLSIGDLLAQLTVARRSKDTTRVALLRERQFRG